MGNISDEIKSKFQSEQHKAVVNVLFTGNWIKSYHTRLLKPYGLSSQQYNILRILRGSKGERLKMQTVVSRMLEKTPNATRLTDKLLEKNLINRERCAKDRRVVYVNITPSGHELLDSVDEAIGRSLEVIYDRLTTEEAAALNSILDKVRD